MSGQSPKHRWAEKNDPALPPSDNIKPANRQRLEGGATRREAVGCAALVAVIVAKAFVQSESRRLAAQMSARIQSCQTLRDFAYSAAIHDPPALPSTIPSRADTPRVETIERRNGGLFAKKREPGFQKRHGRQLTLLKTTLIGALETLRSGIESIPLAQPIPDFYRA